LTAQLQSPWLTFYDSNGNPLVGAKIRIYEPGTLTPLDAFDDEGAAPGDVVSQPFVTNAAGRIPRYFVTEKYRMTVHTSADVLVDDVDDQDPGLPSGFGVSATVQIAQGGTSSTNAPAARAALGAASQTALTALQNDVTALQTAIAPGLNGDDELGTIAALDEIAPAVMTDQVIKLQRVLNTTILDSTITNTVPLDTSIPGIGEGDGVFSTSFTPRSATSHVTVRVSMFAQSSTTTNSWSGHIFNGNTCIASRLITFPSTGTSYGELDIEVTFSPGSTSTITISVRSGVSSGTATLGGVGITFDGTLNSFMEITEWEDEN